MEGSGIMLRSHGKMMAFHPKVVVESLKCFNQKSDNYAYILKFPLNFYIEID